jgi:hypothetical protein
MAQFRRDRSSMLTSSGPSLESAVKPVLGHLMVTRTTKKLVPSAEERFLMQSLRRLRNADQRYIFTLIADLISLGLAASGRNNADTPET